MWQKIKALKEQRAEKLIAMKEIHQRGEDEKRNLTADEAAKFDALRAEADNLNSQIEQTGAINSLDQTVRGGGGMHNMPGRDPIGTQLGNANRFITTDPSEVRALRKDESAIDYIRSRNPNIESKPVPGIGAMMRAMVLGPRNAEERAALAEGTDSTGGYAVSPIVSGQLIDVLRPRNVCFRAGAQLVVLGSDNHSFARIAADATPAWRAEGAAVAESEPTFDRVQFLPKSLAVLVKCSRELLQDAVNLENAIPMVLGKAMATSLDGVALIGTGTSNQPLGISGISGVASVAAGGTNGAQLTSYSKLLDAVYQQRLGNANDPTAFIMHPRVSQTFDKFVDTLGQPLAKPDAIANTPFYPTTALSVTETTGSATNTSRIIAGDFSQLWIGMRSDIRIEVLRERYADNLQYGFIAWLRADIGVQHPASFSQITGILP